MFQAWRERSNAALFCLTCENLEGFWEDQRTRNFACDLLAGGKTFELAVLLPFRTSRKVVTFSGTILGIGGERWPHGLYIKEERKHECCREGTGEKTGRGKTKGNHPETSLRRSTLKRKGTGEMAIRETRETKGQEREQRISLKTRDERGNAERPRGTGVSRVFDR